MRERITAAISLALAAINHRLIGNVSVVEAVTILASFVAFVALLVNAWDAYQELGRAKKGNGAKLTLARGLLRGMLSDGLCIAFFFGIGVIFAYSPPTQSTGPQIRAAALTFFLLGILGGLVYSQYNDFITRRTASNQIDELYAKAHPDVSELQPPSLGNQ